MAGTFVLAVGWLTPGVADAAEASCDDARYGECTLSNEGTGSIYCLCNDGSMPGGDFPDATTFGDEELAGRCAVQLSLGCPEAYACEDPDRGSCVMSAEGEGSVRCACNDGSEPAKVFPDAVYVSPEEADELCRYQLALACVETTDGDGDGGQDPDETEDEEASDDGDSKFDEVPTSSSRGGEQTSGCRIGGSAPPLWGLSLLVLGGAFVNARRRR